MLELYFKLAVILAWPIYYILKSDNEFDRIMKACKIKNFEDQIPKAYNKTKTEYGYRVTFHMPEGVCLKDIKKHQEEIEQFLDGSIELEYTGNNKVVMEVVTASLGKQYQFNPALETQGPLSFPIGYSKKGLVCVSLDDDHPHLLIGGTSGSGKSVMLRCILTYLILRKAVILHLIDLKHGAEFGVFEKCKPVDTFADTSGEACNLFGYLTHEMERRYKLFKSLGVVNIGEYNKKCRKAPLPYHMCCIDEFANLKDNDDAIDLVDGLLRQARACGIHLIIATQRPDADVLPGNLKANVTATIAFKVRNRVNSQILLDNDKAVDLRGKGHGIYSTGIDDVEFQALFLTNTQARALVRRTYTEKVKKLNDTSGVEPYDAPGA